MIEDPIRCPLCGNQLTADQVLAAHSCRANDHCFFLHYNLGEEEAYELSLNGKSYYGNDIEIICRNKAFI